ncbi:MAG: lmo0937 family membrane protein [Spirochaetes bacterium]|nr:lmo0937 family membrane protein [Spirochaetota bacterium]
MIWIIFILLLALWLLGVVSGYVFSGFIHVLLVIAIIVLLVKIFQKRKSKASKIK